jgi:hypothetical protein
MRRPGPAGSSLCPAWKAAQRTQARPPECDGTSAVAGAARPGSGPGSSGPRGSAPSSAGRSGPPGTAVVGPVLGESPRAICRRVAGRRLAPWCFGKWAAYSASWCQPETRPSGLSVQAGARRCGLVALATRPGSCARPQEHPELMPRLLSAYHASMTSHATMTARMQEPCASGETKVHHDAIYLSGHAATQAPTNCAVVSVSTPQSRTLCLDRGCSVAL